jgi:hypothetical protein
MPQFRITSVHHVRIHAEFALEIEDFMVHYFLTFISMTEMQVLVLPTLPAVISQASKLIDQ